MRVGGSLDYVNNSGSTHVNFEGEWQGVSQVLWVYISPIIFLIGVIGNLLILIVIKRPKFRGTSTSIYLFFMALADLLVLIFGHFPEWLSACDIFTFKAYNAVTCKIDKFISYSIGDIAIWILVGFTIDRFIAVCFPFEKSAICKPSRAKLMCLGFLLVAVTKNFHVWWTRGPQEKFNADRNETYIKTCGRPEPYNYFENYVRPWIAFVLVSLLPFIIIAICNFNIIFTILQNKDIQKSASNMASNNKKAYTQMTLMCLSASIAFLLLITPSIVLLIGRPYWDTGNNTAYSISKAISNQLTYVNHSINFILYCLTGKRFREELRNMLTCRKESSVFSESSLAADRYNTPLNSPKFSKKRSQRPILKTTYKHDSVGLRDNSSSRSSPLLSKKNPNNCYTTTTEISDI